MTQLLLNLGLTRDSMIWLWGRLSAGALIILTGIVPLDAYVSPKYQKLIMAGAAVVLWLSGKYDSSPLPGKAPAAAPAPVPAPPPPTKP